MNPTSEDAITIMNDTFQLTQQQQTQLQSLCLLIDEWNDRINLISRKDCNVNVIFGRHVLPCLGVLGLSVFDSNKVKRVVDVGTGGGFPGLPLAIAYPDVDFLLVDSVGKKLTAVENVAERLGLTNVKVHHGRAEELVEESGKFDLCVGRSVAALPKYCLWIQNLLSSDGKLAYMIGGDIEEEILEETESDVDIDELLQYPGASDKRILVFPKQGVTELAKASGLVLKLPNKPSKSKTNNPKRRQKAKGQWTKRDSTAPKQRGYDDFQRYDSTQA